MYHFLNNMMTYRAMLTMIFLLLVKSAISQISYETSKALLIYQFAKNVSHQKHEKIKKYKICFLGNDVKTYRELEKITANIKINGKPVVLSFVKNLSDVGQKQLLYVDKSWAKKIEEVWFKIENKNVLLVTLEMSTITVSFEPVSSISSFTAVTVMVPVVLPEVIVIEPALVE